MERVLIVGAGEGGRIIARELQANPRWRLQPVGFVDDDRRKLGRDSCGLPVLGDTDAIPALVRSEDVDVVIIAIPSAPSATHKALVNLAQESGAHVMTMPALGSILRGESKVTTLRSVRPVDVLGRPVVEPDRESCRQFVQGRTVLITGAAGSIGAELAVQMARLRPARLVLLDTNESGLYDLSIDVHRVAPETPTRTVIASVTDAARIERVFATHRPDIVVHAAAYKHVPAMEEQPDLALETNVLGTDIVVRHAAAYGAARFILISTDKAVRPTSVMGATKRLAELAVAVVGEETGLSVCSVRFGNVLGSRGSVIPTFERQIRAGGPVTVTDPRMKRYFMTIPEAVSLVIQAGAYGDRNVTYILDMGEEVAILELARRVIELHGLRPDVDIPIEITGMRPGEKLYEELTLDFEQAHETPHPKIRLIDGRASRLDLAQIPERLAALLATPEDLAIRIHRLIAETDGESPALEALRANGDAPRPEPDNPPAPIPTIATMAARIPTTIPAHAD